MCKVNNQLVERIHAESLEDLGIAAAVQKRAIGRLSSLLSTDCVDAVEKCAQQCSCGGSLERRARMALYGATVVVAERLKLQAAMLAHPAGKRRELMAAVS